MIAPVEAPVGPSRRDSNDRPTRWIADLVVAHDNYVQLDISIVSVALFLFMLDSTSPSANQILLEIDQLLYGKRRPYTSRLDRENTSICVLHLTSGIHTGE
jgi:hypothetical protein